MFSSRRYITFGILLGFGILLASLSILGELFGSSSFGDFLLFTAANTLIPNVVLFGINVLMLIIHVRDVMKDNHRSRDDYRYFTGHLVLMPFYIYLFIVSLKFFIQVD